jgi:NADH dehydrogenase
MTSIVTGAFGYIGKYIAHHLLQQGEQVATITTHPRKPNPFGDSVRAFYYDFEQPDLLTEHLRGADTLYNTYWVRFEHYGASFNQAVRNTATLFACAKRAGIQKIVHISVTHASTSSDLPYYAGKGMQEQALIDCGVPYSIVRPTLVFGDEDILVNNIAWLMRRFLLFPIFGDGQYRVQPIFVEDLASIAVESAGKQGSEAIDAIGPENYTFEDFVRLIARTIKPQEILFHIPPTMGVILGQLIGLAVGDIILTHDELQGLMTNLLTSTQASNGNTRFSEWLLDHRESIGAGYTSESQRHFK